MQIVGLFLVIVALWCGYCGVQSFNPLSLSIAILASPSGAQALLSQAKSQRDSTTATAPSSSSNSSSSGSTSGGGGAGKGVEFASVSASSAGNYSYFSKYTIPGGGGFGASRPGGRTHQGIDFVMPSGTPLYSPFSGTVINHPNLNSLAGNQVEVKLSDGYTFFVDHVRQFLLSSGSTVTAGTEIALSGGGANDPGKGDATGPHAHVELHTPSGQAVPFNTHAFG